MPELPEVETVTRSLAPLLGRCVNAESALFQAQLRLQELLAYSDFYRALGGGWQ